MKYVIAGLVILPILAACDVVEERVVETRYVRPAPSVEVIPPPRHYHRSFDRRPVPPVVVIPPRRQEHPTDVQGYDRGGRGRVVVVRPDVRIERNRQPVSINVPSQIQPTTPSQVVISRPGFARPPAGVSGPNPSERGGNVGQYGSSRAPEAPKQVQINPEPAKPPVQVTQAAPLTVKPQDKRGDEKKPTEGVSVRSATDKAQY